LAAAGVKVREAILPGVKSHARRAAELFRQTAEEAGGQDCRYLGLCLGELIRFAQDIVDAEIPRRPDDPSAVRPVFDFFLIPA
jgi:hypothetical protein